jgi:hypothetical protein
MASGAFVTPFIVTSYNSLVRKTCPVTATCNVVLTGSGNVLGADPLLAPLAFNGGPSRTHALLPTSPAIDAGSNPLGLTEDQRGFPRVVNGTPDMGAYESPAP